jgi:hypothetical protein
LYEICRKDGIWMNDHKSSKWMCVAVLAAVVAALTTVAVLVLRARAKKKALDAYNDSFNCDLDDCCCDEDCCCDCAAEEVPSEE